MQRNELQACPRCGGNREWHGVCPRCLLNQFIDSGNPTNARRLGRYELIETIGMGGSGTVWRAWDPDFRREVAIKTLRTIAAPTKESLERFRREALITARLRHPRIVPVYDVGQEMDEPFLVMELVSGPTLSDRINGLPMPAREAARTVLEVAEAIQYAHECGVVHRDLKPSNILLDSSNGYVPRLTDFGIAKAIGISDEALTATVAGMGSLAYLAPELAGGGTCGPHTDVFGLGAVLYHCVTGRAPFLAETPAKALKAVLEEDPVAPQVIHPMADRDLENIALKCLEKNPTRRYANVGELTEDLNRFLGGHPIRARPASPLQKALRWVHRKPMVASLVGGLILVILGALIVTQVLRGRAEHLKGVAEAQREELRKHLYAADMKAANEAMSQQHFKQMQQILARHAPTPGNPDLRGIEWHLMRQSTLSGHLASLTNRHGDVTSVEFTPDGTSIYFGDHQGNVMHWQWREKSPPRRFCQAQYPIMDLKFDDSGKVLGIASRSLTTTNGSVEVYDVGTGASLLRVESSVARIALRPSGRELVIANGDPTARSGTGSLELWDISTRSRTTNWNQFGKRVAISRDGSRLSSLSTETEGGMVVMSLPELKVLDLFQCPGGPQDVVFSEDGTVIYTWTGAGRVMAREAVSGNRLVEHVVGGGISRIVSGSNALVLLTFDRRIHVSRFEKEPFRFQDHRVWTSNHQQPTSLAVSRDGRHAACADVSGEIVVWAASAPVSAYPAALEDAPSINSIMPPVVFSPDSQLMIVRHSGKLAGYQMPEIKERFTIPGSPEVLGFCAKGREFLTMTNSGRLITRSADTGAVLREQNLEKFEGDWTCLQPSNSGAMIAGGSRISGASLWDSRTGRLLRTVGETCGRINHVGFSPDDQLLAIPGADGVVRLWEVTSGRERWARKVSDVMLWCCQFSPDGKRIAVCGRRGFLQVRRVLDGELEFDFPGDHGGMIWVSWTPDGERLVGPGHFAVRIWHLPTGREVFRIDSSSPFLMPILSPDGLMLVVQQTTRFQIWNPPFFEAGANGAIPDQE